MEPAKGASVKLDSQPFEGDVYFQGRSEISIGCPVYSATHRPDYFLEKPQSLILTPSKGWLDSLTY